MIILVIYGSTKFFLQNNNFSSFHRMLKTSEKLKLLDLRGTAHLTTEGIQNLPATDLEHLFLSQSVVTKYNSIEVILHKVWSLKSTFV